MFNDVGSILWCAQFIQKGDLIEPLKLPLGIDGPDFRLGVMGIFFFLLLHGIN